MKASYIFKYPPRVNYALYLLLMVFIFSFDLMTPKGLGTAFFYVIPVFLTIGLKTRQTYILGVISSILIIIGFFVSDEGAFYLALFHQLLALALTWSVVLLVVQRTTLEADKALAEAREKEAQKELKILQGFLPTCANCKKIRDDQGNWVHMETYITKHSEAQFSHSICPDCARKLYPELYP